MASNSTGCLGNRQVRDKIGTNFQDIKEIAPPRIVASGKELHSSRPSPAAGRGFPLATSCDEMASAKFDSTDLRSTFPCFTPEALKADLARVDIRRSSRRGP
jgi:hypothetical protein